MKKKEKTNKNKTKRGRKQNQRQASHIRDNCQMTHLFHEPYGDARGLLLHNLTYKKKEKKTKRTTCSKLSASRTYSRVHSRSRIRPRVPVSSERRFFKKTERRRTSRRPRKQKTTLAPSRGKSLSASSKQNPFYCNSWNWKKNPQPFVFGMEVPRSIDHDVFYNVLAGEKSPDLRGEKRNFTHCVSCFRRMYEFLGSPLQSRAGRAQCPLLKLLFSLFLFLFSL
jgi:hypothetical protein